LKIYRTRSKAVSSQPIFNAGTERFIRDWRSSIVTVTVRDQRNREHDPILGVVPMKLSDILETSSQVTRWYPLDGGIGFGRIRISLLFRSIETRLPPNMLGWDVGTFEFTSDRILAVNYSQAAKLRLRTGGSTGKISRSQAQKLPEGDGYFWDLTAKEGKYRVRLPVKYRYRSPIVFEFHIPNKRKADAYAVVWLHHFIDNEEASINIPIWTTAHPARLTQNYITEDNCSKEPGLEDLREVGRLEFRSRFKAGMDEAHETFITDNDSRETFETWEACLAEGVRQRIVEKEMPDRVQQLHDNSLTEGRDVLKDADEDEKKKWLSKSGTDWSGAFGHDPKAYMDTQGRKRREPGAQDPLHDPFHPSNDEYSSDEEDISSDSSDVDLGIQDADNTANAQDMSGGTGGADQAANKASIDTSRTNGTITSTDTQSSKDANRQNKKTEERKQRGLMQWRPARNVKVSAAQDVILSQQSKDANKCYSLRRMKES
jgi:hypothetical protein